MKLSDCAAFISFYNKKVFIFHVENTKRKKKNVFLSNQVTFFPFKLVNV